MDAIEGEDLARQIHELRALVVNLQNMVEGIIKHGPVTDVDAQTQRVRIQIGTDSMDPKKKPQKSAWVPYGLGFAGEFSQIWHPSVGQNMTLVSPHGDKAQSVAYPFTYSKQYPSPSDNPNCHILCNFGSSRIEVWKEQIVIISDNIHFTALKGDITETADRHIEMETKDLAKNTKAVRNQSDDDKEQKTPDKSDSVISQVTGSPDKAISKITLQTGSPNQGDSLIGLTTGAPDNANSKITLQAGSPKQGDSLIGITTGDPGTGTSAIAIQTGKPTTGDTLIAITVNPPIIGSCQYNLVSGGTIAQSSAAATTHMAGLDYTVTAGLNYNVTAGVDTNMMTGNNYNVTAGVDTNMMTGNNYTITAGLNLEAMIGLKVEVFAGAPVEVHAPEIALLGHTDVGGYGGPAIARIGDKVSVDVITGDGAIVTGAGNSNAT